MTVILKQEHVPHFCDFKITENICAITSGDTLKLKQYLFENYQMTEESFTKLLETKELRTQTIHKTLGMTICVTLIIEKLKEI